MTDIKSKMKVDAEKAGIRAKEMIVAINFYSKIAWKALKKPLMGLGMSAILASCGITKVQSQNKDDETKQDTTEQVAQNKNNSEYEYGYSDPDEVVETTSEREAREAEEEYWNIMEGKQTHGNAGTDRARYGNPGKGAPSRLTDDEVEAIYRIKSKVGTGMSHEDMAELEQKVRDNANGTSRDISWAKAIKDAGYGR